MNNNAFCTCLHEHSLKQTTSVSEIRNNKCFATNCECKLFVPACYECFHPIEMHQVSFGRIQCKHKECEQSWNNGESKCNLSYSSPIFRRMMVKNGEQYERSVGNNIIGESEITEVSDQEIFTKK